MDPEQLKSKRSVLKGLCTKSLNKLKNDAKRCDLARQNLLYDKLCKRFDELSCVHTDYLATLAADKLEGEMDYLDDLESQIDDEYLDLTSRIKSAKALEIDSRTAQSTKLVRDQDNDDSRKQNTIFKVDKFEMDIFCGDILKYLPWKEEVIQHYLPYVPDSMQNLALKRLLKEEIQDRVAGCDTVTGTWSELDRIFGDMSKISDKILYELDGYPSMTDADVDLFMQFSERLSKAHLELMKYQKQEDINNSHMIGLMEKKLPPRIRAEWSEMAVKLQPRSDKFKHLLNFVKQKAKAKEYEADPIRNGTTPEHKLNLANPNLSDHHIPLTSRMVPNNWYGYGTSNVNQGYSNNTGAGQAFWTIPPQNQGNFNGQGQFSSPCIVHFRRPASHETIQCKIFMAMSPTDRRSIVLRAKACFLCLQKGHVSGSCFSGQKCYVPGCVEKHHGLLHGARINQSPHIGSINSNPSLGNRNPGAPFGSINSNPFRDRNTPQSSYTNSNPENRSHGTMAVPTGLSHQASNSNPNANMGAGMNSTNPFLNMSPELLRMNSSKGELIHHQQSVSGPNPMLPFQKVTSDNMILSVLFDSGSTLSIINDSVARAMKFTVHDRRTINLVKTGGQSEIINSYIYVVPLKTKQGHFVNVNAFGIHRISSELERVESQSIEKLFKMPIDSLCRPSGKVDLLVGTDVAGLHPVPIATCENMILGTNPFGYVVWGAHPSSECSGTVTNISMMTNATMDDFFQIESLGVECVPRCGSCQCGECPLGAKPYTIREERELELIRSGIKYDTDHWVCTYPWVKDPGLLPDNYSCAFAQLNSLEKRLRKDPELMRLYSEQVDDMVKRDVAHVCSMQELSAYRGPFYYLSHHEILKKTSTSTPCRIVFNPAQNFRGHVLNDYWALGTNLVQSLFDILLRFREYTYGIMGDVSKMYHSVHTTPLEWHTHRFLWRNFENRKPDIYVFTRNSFGDKPAGTIATMAIQMTVDKFGKDHSSGSRVLGNSLYVDDIVDSTRSIEEANEVMRDTETLLAKGGFKIKEWVTTGKADRPLESTIERTGRVLGMILDARNDYLKFKMKLNFNRRKQRKPGCVDLTLEDVPGEVPQDLTKRHVSSQVNGIFDPIGLIAPFIAKAKIGLRKVWMFRDPTTQQKLDWDDPFPEELRDIWLEWFQESFQLDSLEFSRCLTPSPLPLEQPMLIMFSDASTECMAAAAYIRYEISPTQIFCRLITAKTRATPLQAKTIVQYEMQAAVLSKRLATSVTKALRIKFKETKFLVDSEIVRAMLCKDSYGFKSWYALRIGEIVSSTDPAQWYWIDGKQNIADWATRGKSPLELGPETEWQTGPKFLYKPENEWPTRQSYTGDALPGLRLSHLAAMKIDPDTLIGTVMDVSRFSNLYRLLSVTARLILVVEQRSLLAMLERPKVAHVYQARKYWIITAQREKTEQTASLVDRFNVGEYDNLVPFFDRSGILRVKGRAFADERLAPVLLPQQHRLSRLIVEEVHARNHEGISTVVTKVREFYWIVGATRVAKSVRHHCTICKRSFGELQKQVMADLPPERLTPSLPFQHVSIDLFGRYELKIPGKSTRGRQFIDEKKAYGVLYTCLSSRAVYVDVARGYSLDAFLMVHRRFLSIRGAPATLYSDGGPQLTAADKELHQELTKKWDLDVLERHGVKLGTTWKFCAPESPWQNGVSESLVRGVKRSLTLVIGDHPKMTFEELQTFMFEAANLINERPIGRHPTSPDETAYLRPNDLLLGRASDRIPAGPWNTGNDRQRFLLVQAIVNDWMKRWRRDYFPTLVPRRQWHTASRPVEIGDLVLIHEDNLVRGEWRTGQVIKIHPSADGRVRNVDLRYKNLSRNEPSGQYRGVKDSIITRSVQKLVVIGTKE